MHRKRVVLLAFCCFILAGTARSALFQKKSSSDITEIQPGAVIVAIPVTGELYFNKVRVEITDLPEKIRQALKDNPREEQVVYIKAGISVRYGYVVSVVDAIREAGFDQIGLVANKKWPSSVKTDDAPDYPPRSSAATSSAVPTVILIEVRSKTRLKLNSTPMLLSRLDRRLRNLLAGRTDKTVFIKAPRKLPYGDVVKVIDIAKGAGAVPIGLQVDYLK